MYYALSIPSSDAVIDSGLLAVIEPVLCRLLAPHFPLISEYNDVSVLECQLLAEWDIGKISLQELIL